MGMVGWVGFLPMMLSCGDSMGGTRRGKKKRGDGRAGGLHKLHGTEGGKNEQHIIKLLLGLLLLAIGSGFELERLTAGLDSTR